MTKPTPLELLEMGIREHYRRTGESCREKLPDGEAPTPEDLWIKEVEHTEWLRAMAGSLDRIETMLADISNRLTQPAD